MQSEICCCDTGRKLAACCGRYLQGASPPDALALMRARYTAFATGQIDFIVDSQRGQAANGFDREEATAWALRTQFTGLDIVDFKPLSATAAEVEFKAHLVSEGVAQCLHERSYFTLYKGRWFYIKGRAQTDAVARNHDCPCGSGKKYKHCCENK